MLTEIEAESETSGPGHAEVTDSATYAGYARRAFVYLVNLRRRVGQTTATWDAMTGRLIEDVFGENVILQYLQTFWVETVT